MTSCVIDEEHFLENKSRRGRSTRRTSFSSVSAAQLRHVDCAIGKTISVSSNLSSPMSIEINNYNTTPVLVLYDAWMSYLQPAADDLKRLRVPASGLKSFRSFPRKRESSCGFARWPPNNWIPVFAGTSGSRWRQFISAAHRRAVRPCQRCARSKA